VASAHGGTELRLVGGFDLRLAGQSARVPQASQRLLAFLALHRRPLRRAFVAGNLWADVTDERAAANLRASIWRLPGPPDALVSCNGNHIGLHPSVDVDYDGLLTDAREALDGHCPCVGARRLLVAGDLLPGWGDDWIGAERERLRQLRLHALEAWSGALLDEGGTAQAIDVSLTAVASEPLRESAQRTLVRAHIAEGNVGEALRAYERFARLLWERCELRPSHLMQDLIQPLLGRGTPIGA
jgi:DNA-binding SARP family transcriptional activator